MSSVVKRVSRGCQEGVKSCEEGVKSCEEGGMTQRVTMSRRCQELSRVCQDCVTKEHGVEGRQVPVGFRMIYQVESGIEGVKGM